jgi:hypothetical protein
MQVVSLGAFVDDQHSTTLALQQVIPVQTLMKERGIAQGMGEVRIIEGAAQAAGDAVGTGGMGEAKGFEFSGNLGDDSRLGSKDASGEQGEAVKGGSRDTWSGGSETLAESLIEWQVSGHTTSTTMGWLTLPSVL